MERPGHEIVGQRRVGAMASAELVDMWCRITSSEGWPMKFGCGDPRRAEHTLI